MGRVVESKDIKQLIKRNQSQHSELNSALIVAAAIWGVKAGELSLIEIRDVLDPKGQLYKKWTLRGEISFNGYARTLYTEHEALIRYVDLYLKWRRRKGLGATNIGEYCSLDPDSKLFLTADGKPFSFFKRSTGNKVNMQPTGMNYHFKRIFKNSGINGISYKDFRNSLAIQMFREGERKTGVLKDIMEYLGIRSYSALRKIINSDTQKIHDMVKGIHYRI